MNLLAILLLAAATASDDTNTIARIKSLGDQRSPDAVAECDRHLDTATGDLKDVCLYALSRTTSPQAAKLLRARLADNAAATAYLRHGETLLLLSRTREPAAAVALDLLHASSAAVRCGAVALLADAQGGAAQPALLAALDDPDRSVREQASRQLTRMPAAAELLAAFRVAKDERRTLLFDAIARRADADTAFLVQALSDADKNIKHAAGLALRNKTGSQVDAGIAKLLPLPDALDLLAARRARAQVAAVMPLINNPAVSKQAFAALAVLAGEPEVEKLIALALASKDEAFRDQITKTISLAAPRLAGNTRCVAALVNVPSWGLALLPAFGGKEALDAVVAATTGNDREAAVRALADWRDLSAMEPLLALCRDAGDERLCALAARGAIRIATQAEIDKKEKAALLKKVIEAAPREEEKQQAQAALQGLDKKQKPTRGKKK